MTKTRSFQQEPPTVILPVPQAHDTFQGEPPTVSLSRVKGCSTFQGDEPPTVSLPRARAGKTARVQTVRDFSGSVIANRYHLIEEIGSGSHGWVYRARDLESDREVAVKLLQPEAAGNPELCERLTREALALAQIHHPHVVSLHDFGYGRDGDPFMVIEYVAGEPLDRFLKCRARLSWREAAELTMQLLAALKAIHDARIVHGDIKASNIIVKRSAAGLRLVLIDFSVATLIDIPTSDEHQRKLIVGTPGYIAPQAILGQPATTANDIYAVGMLLHVMLIGRMPFSGSTAHAVMRQQLEQVRRSGVKTRALRIPDRLCVIIRRATAFAVARRFASVRDFSRAMRAVLAHATRQWRHSDHRVGGWPVRYLHIQPAGNTGKAQRFGQWGFLIRGSPSARAADNIGTSIDRFELAV